MFWFLDVINKLLVNLTIIFILFYRLIAPKRVRNSCRFTPTCSEYSIQVLKKYGFLIGVKKTINRLKRCKPPNGGEDNP